MSTKTGCWCQDKCLKTKQSRPDGYSQAENNSLTILVRQQAWVQRSASTDSTSHTECVTDSFLSHVTLMSHAGKCWVTSPWTLIKRLRQAQNKPGKWTNPSITDRKKRRSKPPNKSLKFSQNSKYQWN